MPYFTVTLERYIQATDDTDARRQMAEWLARNPADVMEDMNVIPEATFQKEVK